MIGFPFPYITNIERQSIYKTFEELNYQLNTNIASVQSNLGGGVHSYLELMVLPTVFATLSVTRFVIQLDPGPTGDIIGGLTVTQFAIVRLDHTNVTALFIKYNHIDSVLKQ